jgi:hypothetical protein
MLDQVVEGLKSYLKDPASTDYQKGYLAALIDLYAHPGRVGALSPGEFVALQHQIH